jgi:hypothetical protein
MSAIRKAMTISADKLAWYDKLVATHPSLQRKGAAMPYTSVGGHMFSFLTPEGKLALRLPAAAREAFLKKYRANPASNTAASSRSMACAR